MKDEQIIKWLSEQKNGGTIDDLRKSLVLAREDERKQFLEWLKTYELLEQPIDAEFAIQDKINELEVKI